MVNTYKYKNVTWVDMQNPTREEARELMQKYDIHPVAAEELILPTTRSKVDRYQDFVYLVLHFPAWKHSHRNTNQEIDFIIGKNFIVTARYDTIDPLHKFSKMFEVNSVLDHNGLIGEHAGYMFYYMMREIYHSIADELESVRDSLDDIEKRTFSGEEREMVFELSNTARELLIFKHATAFHKEILESFGTASIKLFGPDYAHYMEATMSEYTKVGKAIQGLTESLHELRETNNSLLETKQNKVMMTLTGITFITAILGIIVGIFEVNFKDAPIIGMPHDFWILSGVITALGIFFTAILAHKKWL
ncbi:MAG TPA: magnesium transporter CorA family protein [Candidatus Paceibacterota bacterium]|nr:magnesium transporter CorA family protein [Candidatus Paceibacterota bacterium]